MGIKIIEKNRKASFNYFLLEKVEAGIVLTGSEIKSIREGLLSIAESYVEIKNNEAFIKNMYIAKYKFAATIQDEKQPRKLLLHRREIKKIVQKLQAEHLTIVPTAIYFKDGYVKLELAIAKGKKLYDKREDLAKKSIDKKLRQKKFD